MKYLVAIFISTFLITGAHSQGNSYIQQSNYLGNRAPLANKTYIELPIGAIQPQGWLKEQLNRMRTGMTGYLDSIYSQVVGQRNGWIGGDGDVWERGPYWIDGLLPLAYIMNDTELKKKVQPWIEWTLASQKPNGYFGPDTDREPEEGLQRNNSRDWWPKMVMLKVMQQYYSATGDKRIISFMTNYFNYQLKELPNHPLGNWTFWGEQRGGDNLMMVYWLYNITGDSFLLELGELIHKQTFNWTDVFLRQDHLSRQHSLHCVNLGQGFKEPVVYFQQNQNPEQLKAVKKAVRDMRNTIGLPIGLWAGDELLRFGNPVQGSELCTAVEMMYSLESILQITGDVQWADHLEKIAYNALPTQTTDNFDARQYYQQVNQIKVSRDIRNFVTPHHDTDNLFGELTGYPCCTSNMHQGWPKFTQNLWYATNDNGIAALIYAPSEVLAKVGNGKFITVKESTQYPFKETITFTIEFRNRKEKEIKFPFHLRIPEWCKNPVITINGENATVETRQGEIAKINRIWKNNDKIVLHLPMEVSISQWYDGGAAVERGPLLYALKMNENWQKKTTESHEAKRYGKWYYQVTSDAPWNYALPNHNLRKENIKNAFIVEIKDSAYDYPWTLQNAPITIKTKGLRLPGWKEYSGSTGPIPFFTQQGEDVGKEEDIELIPYGCSTLRIAVFPVRNK
ncbi:MAG TPA: hypothetical protein GXX42_10285 [Petrimonas sp.]|uniref:beta-L-arabinofuranosidase domain-containing protein n=1 Tax=Petrimonas sp. TaxID=2023866 RepID=UPI001765A6AA|nr:hypothetical protein [Petrimonas sp.]